MTILGENFLNGHENFVTVKQVLMILKKLIFLLLHYYYSLFLSSDFGVKK